ncbi:RND transporter [Echinicola rosea]|uniref:RND transporter n=2 Tax=Echinicola rosea TaxID=1807691 RepID=A0ABQ1UYW9_9BACT|nr:RND transporter [Echinicola rosea]
MIRIDQKVILSIIIIAGIFGGCKSIDIPEKPDMPKIPATFIGEKDSINIAHIPWNKFFNDPNLNSLIEEALEHNLDMLAAVERIEVATAQYRIEKGRLYPTVDGIARYRSGNIKPNLLSGTVNGDRNVDNQIERSFLGFQSTWEIDLWGKVKNRKKAAHQRILATEKGRLLVQTTLIAEVAKLYYELLGFDKELETINKNIDYQEIALELIKIQKMAGRANELAVQQFAAQLLATKSLRYEKEQEIIAAENSLNYLLGRYPEEVPRAESLLDINLPEAINVGVPTDLLLRRPDVQQAELELLATDADLAAARAEFFPSLSLTPYIGLNEQNIPSAFNFPGALTVGFLGGITAPIFQQFKIRSGFNKSIANNRIAYYQYQQAIMNGYREVLTNLRRVDKMKKKYALKEEETQVLLNSIQIANDLFRGGYATYLEVITAQARALEAELEMTNTRKEVFLSVVDLYRSLGGGWN